MNERFDLERFVTAQNPEWEGICSELRQGCKRSHWMWFVFPQLRGLGRSSTAVFFGISSDAEAEAYLGHPVLGQRLLLETTQLINSIEGRSIEAILGSVDSIKLRSSMTLFHTVSQNQAIFGRALDKYFGGIPDELTLGILGETKGS